MATLRELFSVLDGLDGGSGVEPLGLYLNPDPALKAAKTAVATGEGLQNALQMVEEQIALARPALRGLIHDVIEVKRSEREKTTDRMRQMLCDLHLAVFRINRVLKNWDEARSHLVRAHACGSDNPYPEQYFVELYVEMEQYSAALACLKKMVSGKEDAPFLVFQFAVDLAVLGAEEEVREALEWARSNDPLGLVGEICGIRLDAQETGRKRPSLDELEESFQRGGRALQAGEPETGLANLLHVVGYEPMSGKAWFLIGYVYRVGLGEPETFLERANQAISVVGDLSANEARYQEVVRATRAFKYAINADLEFAEAYYELSQCYLWLERPNDALWPAHAYAELHPDEAAAQSNLSMVHLVCGNLEPAVRAVEAALELDADDPGAIQVMNAIDRFLSQLEEEP